MKESHSKLLTTKKVAQICQCSVEAVKKWIRDGKLPAFTTPGKHYRIEPHTLRQFMIASNMKLPECLKNLVDEKWVMIVYDDIHIQELIKTELSRLKLGLEFINVETPNQALILAGAYKPIILILDMDIPQTDILDVIKTLSSTNVTRGCKIIPITRHPTPQALRIFETYKIENWFAKPLDLKALANLVRDIL